MSEKIEPALTAKQWREATEGGRVDLTYAIQSTDSGVESVEAHATAALALYGQPFGFTREDVHALRQSAIALETDAAAFEVDNARYITACRSLADRIEALLPPEK